MTTVYRLVNARHRRDAFSGEDARLYGGRWNPPGFAVIYASQSRALAVLEMIVHLAVEARDLQFLLFALTLPSDVRQRDYAGPERIWRRPGAPQVTQNIGREWLTQGDALALRAPSVIVPREMIVILNVAHPQFAQVEISKPQPFSLDPRLWN